MMGRRVVAGLLATLLVVAVLVALGRWERNRHADEQTRGMQSVLVAVGQLDGPTLSAFRYLPKFQCLAYRRERNPLALELCFDAVGRVVEAIDRRSGRPEIWSLREDPTRSTLRVDRSQVDRLLVRMGVPPRLIRAAHERATS
jgi:hypothetical protein